MKFSSRDFESRCQEILGQEGIEDLLLRPHFLAYYSQSQWTILPHESVQDLSSDFVWSLAREWAERNHLVLSLTQPTSDALLDFVDGSRWRAHIVIPPFVESGPEITLRKIRPANVSDVDSFFSSAADSKRIRTAVQNGDSILISGATGSGKTTLLKSLLALLPRTTRVVLLEDTREIETPNPISCRLMTRSDRYGFREGVHWELADLLRESLRMRPERIILGECRGREAEIICQVRATGHRGLMSTLHATSAEGALDRFANLAGLHRSNSVLSVWDWVLHLREENGQRRVHEILQPKELHSGTSAP